MSPSGEAKDTQASRAKPRRAARGCERGWRSTLSIGTPQAGNEGARRARRRAIAAADAPTHTWRYRLKEAAK